MLMRKAENPIKTVKTARFMLMRKAEDFLQKLRKKRKLQDLC